MAGSDVTAVTLAQIVGRLRAKIVHFFDKRLKIGTGVH